jgi:hypothetical protein
MRSSKDAGALLEATTTARVSDGIVIHARLVIHRSSVSEAQYRERERPEPPSKGFLIEAQVAHAPRTVRMVKLNNYSRIINHAAAQLNALFFRL